MSYDYRLVKCSRCGSTSALEFGACRVCGKKLKASNTASIFMLVAGIGVLLMGGFAVLVYLTRGTSLGGFIILSVLGLSMLMSVISYIWLLVAAFRVSGMWGFACIALPFAQLAFLYKYTDRAILPVSLNFFSLLILLIARFALVQQ
jgi:hypothetical protein